MSTIYRVLVSIDTIYNINNQLIEKLGKIQNIGDISVGGDILSTIVRPEKFQFLEK